jgi:23S rRNA (adenine2503-C2)-methyltransferase
MRYLSLLSDQELKEWLQTNNEAGFRAKQIFSWIFDQWVPSIMEMKNIPQKLRQKLDESFIYGKSKIVEEESTGDMTEKLLINLNDNECVENVIIRTEDRTTFCLSSQVGCAVQ